MIDLSNTAARDLRTLAAEAAAERARLSAWWAEKSVDHAQGGFVGEIGADGVPRPNADKSVILNTRLLWFFSEAHAGADLSRRAADYIRAHFADPLHGGLFWMVDREGRPIDRRKQAYAQAFGLYAFAARFAATADKTALETALVLFECLETNFLDSEGGGYWEARAEDFSPVADMRLSDRDLNAPKSMNTHLHILEAYTALHRVHRSAPVAHALERAIRLLIERIYDPESGHLALFFERDWRRADSAISFGHDIEASWLLHEAAEELGDTRLRGPARACTLRLADATFAEAVGPNGEIFEERDADGHVSTRRVWWIQAEALVGFLNAFEMTSQARYLDAAMNAWRFIRAHQIDREGGEWLAASTLDPPADPPDLKAGPWKCPYHTGRAMMEVERRAAALLDAASPPARTLTR